MNNTRLAEASNDISGIGESYDNIVIPTRPKHYDNIPIVLNEKQQMPTKDENPLSNLVMGKIKPSKPIQKGRM